MSTITTTPDPVRAQLHAMWSGVAGAWAVHLAYIDARGQHITDRMLELSRPRPGERVLELACGTGGPGLDAAPLVAPGGEVVISDVAAEMTAIAAERIAERGLLNASARVLDLEHIDEAGLAPTTSCCAAKGSCSSPIRPPPHARSGASCARAAASRSRLGPARAKPLAERRLRRGHRAAGRRRLRRRASPIRSRSRTPASWSTCWQRPGWPASRSVSSRRRTARHRSMSGGSAPPPSRDRWRGSSRSSRTRPPGR